MPNTERGKRARKAANVYAPVPVDSPVMYGLVAIVLLGLAMWVFVQFYGFDLTTHPILIALGFVIIFISAVLLRKRRMRHHNLAFDEEYKRDRPLRINFEGPIPSGKYAPEKGAYALRLAM